MIMYYIMTEGDEKTLAMTTDINVAEYMVRNYPIPCFYRISIK